MNRDNHICHKNRGLHLHWTAIFAGAFVGLGLGFLLSIFSVAIGLSAYTSTPGGASVIAIGGFLGLLIGVIASMGTAGFVAGYLGRFYHCYCEGGVIYGFITWTMALLLSALLIMPLTQYIAFYEENLNPALTSTQISTADGDVSASQHNVSTPNVPTQQNPVVTSQHLAWSSWILFALFFVGAFSSCIGACCGMRCKQEEVNTTNSIL